MPSSPDDPNARETANSRGDALIARRSEEQGTTSSDLAARTLRQAFGNGHLPLKGEGALAKGSLPEGLALKATEGVFIESHKFP